MLSSIGESGCPTLSRCETARLPAARCSWTRAVGLRTRRRSGPCDGRRPCATVGLSVPSSRALSAVSLRDARASVSLDVCGIGPSVLRIVHPRLRSRHHSRKPYVPNGSNVPAPSGRFDLLPAAMPRSESKATPRSAAHSIARFGKGSAGPHPLHSRQHPRRPAARRSALRSHDRGAEEVGDGARVTVDSPTGTSGFSPGCACPALTAAGSSVMWALAEMGTGNVGRATHPLTDDRLGE